MRRSSPAASRVAVDRPAAGHPVRSAVAGQPLRAAGAGRALGPGAAVREPVRAAPAVAAEPVRAVLAAGQPVRPAAAAAEPVRAAGNPYGQQQQPQQGNPYAASGPQHNPYAPQQGSNPYAAPYATTGYQPYAQRPKTNTLAILSIVFSGVAGLSLLTFVFAFFAVLAGPAGAILGHVALGKTKTTGESGRGLALAGIIVGWIATGIALIGVIVFFVVLANSGGGYSDPYDYDSGAFIR